MRSLSTDTIKNFNEQYRIPWTPVFDNVTSADTARSNRLTSTPQNSKIARVPILGGSNANEGRLYSISANDSSTFIRGLFPTATDSDVAWVLANYPIGMEFSNDFERLAALYTDFVFQCPARLVALETAQVGIPSWRYYYNASFPELQLFNNAGVYHSSEIKIVLGTYAQQGATPFQNRLSGYIQKIWANFAKDPYGFGRPPWLQVPAAMGMLGGGVRAEQRFWASGELLTVLNQQQTDLVDKRCALWQSIYDALGR
jgi:carboxylesterase type B